MCNLQLVRSSLSGFHLGHGTGWWGGAESAELRDEHQPQATLGPEESNGVRLTENERYYNKENKQLPNHRQSCGITDCKVSLTNHRADTVPPTSLGRSHTGSLQSMILYDFPLGIFSRVRKKRGSPAPKGNVLEMAASEFNKKRPCGHW